MICWLKDFEQDLLWTVQTRLNCCRNFRKFVHVFLFFFRQLTVPCRGGLSSPCILCTLTRTTPPWNSRNGTGQPLLTSPRNTFENGTALRSPPPSTPYANEQTPRASAELCVLSGRSEAPRPAAFERGERERKRGRKKEKERKGGLAVSPRSLQSRAGPPPSLCGRRSPWLCYALTPLTLRREKEFVEKT